MGVYGDGFEKFVLKILIPIFAGMLVAALGLGAIYTVVTAGMAIAQGGILSWVRSDWSALQTMALLAYIVATLWLFGQVRGFLVGWIYAGRTEDPDVIAEKRKTEADIAIDTVLMCAFLLLPIALGWSMARAMLAN